MRSRRRIRAPVRTVRNSRQQAARMPLEPRSNLWSTLREIDRLLEEIDEVIGSRPAA